MKRIATGLAVAALAALFAPPASAEHPICVYGRTPYPIICVEPPEAG